MKKIIYILALPIALLSMGCKSPLKNAKTVEVSISGNCGMCKERIETAGFEDKSSVVDWNKDTKRATITFDSIKTQSDVVLKRIALAGHDNEQFLAPDEVYLNLHECCQYERTMKPTPTQQPLASEQEVVKADTTVVLTQEKGPDQIKAVFDQYFALKDVFVKSDGSAVAQNAKNLLKSLHSIDMSNLSQEEHLVWMKIQKDIISDVTHITESTDIEHQRDHFSKVSNDMYSLLKVSNLDAPTYYQHCPMANEGEGANWLSKESVIKNPYYGSKMLSCGSTVETIK